MYCKIKGYDTEMTHIDFRAKSKVRRFFKNYLYSKTKSDFVRFDSGMLRIFPKITKIEEHIFDGTECWIITFISYCC